MSWCYENDNVLIHCPYMKNSCEQNDPLLMEMMCDFHLCACHITGDYKYANSVEYLEELAAEEEKAAYQEFEHSHKGRICRNHMEDSLHMGRCCKTFYRKKQCKQVEKDICI